MLEFFASLTPGSWFGGILIGLGGTLIAGLAAWLWQNARRFVPGTEEYETRIREQELKDAAAVQDNEVVLSRKINDTEVKIFSGNIVRSSAQAIVSSDDTLLSATSGVAKSIAKAGGRAIKTRLRELSAFNLPRGTLAITGGGKTKYRYIIHAITLTKSSDFTEYPSKDEVRSLVERIIDVSDSIGVQSVAIPVLAGGTAAKLLRQEGLLTSQDIIHYIAVTIFAHLQKRRSNLKTLYFVVFDKNDLQQALVDRLAAA